MPTQIQPDSIKIFANNDEVARAFAEQLVEIVNQKLNSQPSVSVCLSGGSTPQRLFEILAADFAERLDWSKIEFFWGDERCVEPTDPQSNFGVAESLLLSKVNLPPANIHRIRGESDPEIEAVRYAKLLGEKIGKQTSDAVPVFDVMMLGLGTDGHTASIFPHQIQLLQSSQLCAVAKHPDSGQLRISITGSVINNAERIFLLTTGASKASVLREIVAKTGKFASYPASHLDWNRTELFIDVAAAGELSH